jgi:hypothetical protein
MPTYDELVSAIYVFLQEIEPRIYQTTMGTGGDLRLPSLLIEIADPTRFTEEHQELVQWWQKRGHDDYGQNAFLALKNMQELCNRARQYPAESGI